MATQQPRHLAPQPSTEADDAVREAGAIDDDVRPVTEPPDQARPPARRRHSRRRRFDWRGGWIDRRRDVAGIGAIVAAIAAYLSPALRGGTSFGTFDSVISFTSLGSGLYSGPVHNPTDGDVISQMETWNLFDWRQIHAGHFPLWNPFALLGLPQFANFQSSVLSLPDLVGYAFPARYAFLVAVVMKLLIAGTGVYVFCRVVGLGAIASAFAGITYLLSGGFSASLSWPFSDVFAWVGWMAAFAVLAYRWPGRIRYVAGLAVATAFSIYGGFPEANVIVALFLAAAGVVIVVCLLARRVRLHAGGLVRILGGLVAGGALAMPLILPGAQYAAGAHRDTEVNFLPVPGKAIITMAVPGFDGFPIHGSHFLIPTTNFYETVSYVGIAVLVLAVVAVVALPRQPVVIAMAVGAVLLVAVAYSVGAFHPLLDLLKAVGLSTIVWRRARLIIGFPLGVLAAVGLETLLRSRGPSRAAAAFALMSVLAAVGIAALWVHSSSVGNLQTRSIERSSLAWPAVIVGVCLLCAALVLAAGGMRRPQLRRTVCGVATAALFAGNAAFLVSAGMNLNTWTKGFYPESSAMKALQAAVGTDVVGVDDGRATVQSLSAMGFYPELNVAYGVTEFAGHDPLLPQTYFTALAPGQGNGGLGLFVPSIASVAEANELGVSWLLVPAGRKGPVGASYVETLAGQQLFHVPGSARFSLQPSSAGKVVSSSQGAAGSYSLEVSDTAAATLVAHVTDVPGWHATIDGKPVPLQRFDGVMQSLSVPAGTHRIRLWYSPGTVLDGGVLAGVAALGLLLAGVISIRRRASRRPEAIEDGLSLAPALESGGRR
ncbi:MAG: YfhO family protein [Acidimicrobiales bacterium]